MTSVSFIEKMNKKDKLIEYVFSNEITNIDEIKSNFSDFSFEEFDVSSILLSKGERASESLILIKGKCDIINETDFTEFLTIDKLSAPVIIGYNEFLSQIENYTSYVVASEKCFAYRINNNELDNIIQSNNVIAYEILKMYHNLTVKSHISNEQYCTFSRKDILGHYLYNIAKDSLPYTYPYYRSDLANQLYINLRTLYRYLDDLKESGYVSIVKGKIIISEKEFKKLKERYGNIVL